jgi:hypothetical protein
MHDPGRSAPPPSFVDIKRSSLAPVYMEYPAKCIKRMQREGVTTMVMLSTIGKNIARISS